LILSGVVPVRAVALALAFCAIAASPRLGANLASDSDALLEAWRKQGDVVRLEPRFHERGELEPLVLPAAWVDPKQPGCTSVAVLATPGNHFTLRFWAGPRSPEWFGRQWPTPSVAGAAQIVRCGPRKAILAHLALQMRSPRGVVEVVVGKWKKPLPDLRRVLPRRNPGPAVVTPVSTPRARSAPLTERVEALKREVHRQGAVSTGRAELAASTEGTASDVVELEAGCHRFDILGQDASDPSQATADIDAELLALDGAVLSEDRGDNADATLKLCTGEPSRLRLRYGGAVPESRVTVLHARWELPAAVPASWGPEARGRLSDALREYDLDQLTGRPVYASLGVQGVTQLPLEVEPGTCYVAAVGVVQGRAQGLSIAVQAGSQQAQNYANTDTGSTAVAFCSTDADRALVEIEGRGSVLAWVLAVWQAARVPIGAVNE
jgi:hypothetical protein